MKFMLLNGCSDVPDLRDLLHRIDEAFLRKAHPLDTCASDDEVRVGLGDMIPHAHRCG